MFREFSQNSDAPVTRFEQMLKTNQVYFFDAVEFETIIQFYIDTGEINLAKKALQMAINQHPLQTDLLLLKSELLIFDGEYEQANNVLSVIEEMEPSNQEIYIQKATIQSKKKHHLLAIEYLSKSLEFTDEPGEIWCLLAKYIFINSVKYVLRLNAVLERSFSRFNQVQIFQKYIKINSKKIYFQLLKVYKV